MCNDNIGIISALWYSTQYTIPGHFSLLSRRWENLAAASSLSAHILAAVNMGEVPGNGVGAETFTHRMWMEEELR